VKLSECAIMVVYLAGTAAVHAMTFSESLSAAVLQSVHVPRATSSAGQSCASGAALRA